MTEVDWDNRDRNSIKIRTEYDQEIDLKIPNWINSDLRQKDFSWISKQETIIESPQLLKDLAAININTEPESKIIEKKNKKTK